MSTGAAVWRGQHSPWEKWCKRREPWSCIRGGIEAAGAKLVNAWPEAALFLHLLPSISKGEWSLERIPSPYTRSVASEQGARQAFRATRPSRRGCYCQLRSQPCLCIVRHVASGPQSLCSTLARREPWARLVAPPASYIIRGW
jgi:hypothetical protein